MCDVYDSPAWKSFMGPVTCPNRRIGLLFCIDAIPAFAEGSLSIKPGGCMNISLPPVERGKPENMLLMIVMPTSVKGEAQRKYFDFAASYELNEMFHDGNQTFLLFEQYIHSRIPQMHAGVEGVKVKVFSTSMDTPGRSELMGKCKVPMIS